MKRCYFVKPINKSVRNSILAALKNRNLPFVQVDGCLLVSPATYKTAVAPAFVNLLDLPVDSRESYDMVAVETAPTEAMPETNPSLYEKINLLK